MAETYSRVASFALKKETTANTAVIPNSFIGINEEDISTEYAFVPSMPLAANRTKNIRSVNAPIPAPEGTITVNVEPMKFGHFLNGLFGGLTSGRWLQLSGITGTYLANETVTGSGSFSATVAYVGDDFLLLASPSNTPTGTITGGTSAATGTAVEYDSTVYGHAASLPATLATTYTMQFNYSDWALRYIGVRMMGLDTLGQNDNIITAGIKIMAQGQFRHAYITAITTSGSGSKTLTMDQTYGLVASDSIKLYRPGTGFLDFSASGVKTHTIGTVATTTTITVTDLQTSTAVGDIIVLAPQTASYSVGNEFTWIGGAVGQVGPLFSSLASVSMEDFTFGFTNEFESRHAASGTLLASRFPAAILQKGLVGVGSMKAYYQNENFFLPQRRNTARAVRMQLTGDVIGATTLYHKLWIYFPEVRFDPYDTNLGEDAVVDEEVNFQAFYNSTLASAVKVVLVNNVTSY